MLSIYSDNVVSANLSFPCQHTPQRLIVRIGHNHDSLQQRMRKQESAISRVLSWTIIHLRQPSPTASSNLPGSPFRPGVGRNPLTPLFGLAPGGVCHATECCHPRGALLPHHFTLTNACALAVYFLWHFPWVRTLQELPGALPNGARTFLCISMRYSDCLADSYFLIPLLHGLRIIRFFAPINRS